MSYINPYSRFSDPYITPASYVPQQPSATTAIEPSIVETLVDNPQPGFAPIIVKTISDLPDASIIVYRGTPTGFARGPNVQMPAFNFEISNSAQHSRIHATCTSTYPDIYPYNQIADRYEVRVYPDGCIVTLADGCGLPASSKLAPAAAMKGFWEHLTQKLRNDQEGFKVQKLAQYLYEAIEAGHFNIYWDAYLRNSDLGYAANKQKVINNMQNLRNNTELSAEELQVRQAHITQDLDTIVNALKGHLPSQAKLIQNNLDQGFYHNFAGATTFFCSALIKSGTSSETPYYLLSISLGDCKGYLFRDGVLQEVTKDTREDLSNARDPGGKIGLCTPFPLVMDSRNLQFSLTPCNKGDVLFFMTDGVVDNLDPERLGLLPNAKQSSDRILQKIQMAGEFTNEEFAQLIDLLQVNEESWSSLPLDEANQKKAFFGQKLLEKIISKAPDAQQANEKIVEYCRKITSDYREEKPHFFNLFEQNSSPIGKPDHTTCLTIEV